MTTGPLAIATAVDATGVRVYMKMADGTVIVEYNPTTQKQIEAAQKCGDTSTLQEIKPWHRLKGTYRCDPQSGLCAYIWRGGNVAIFHEKDGELCYWLDERALNSNAKACSEADRISIPNPSNANMQFMHGTQLAVTGTLDGGEIMLYYQDKEGYLCRRSAEAMIWKEPVRLCKAVKGTGIAAVSWSNHAQVRVYYQEENYEIKEVAMYSNTWAPGSKVLGMPKALTSMAVVHWFGHQTKQTELRLYYQVGQSGIHEKCWSAGQQWHGDLVLYDAFVSRFNVIAFTRGEADNPAINLWIASKEGRVLLQRAYNHKNAWAPAVGHAIPRTDYVD